MQFRNSTQLDSARLEALFRRCAAPWPLDGLDVRVRYTRSTPFSGVCFYRTGRIHVNVGRRVRYPYRLRTHVARPRTTRRGWWRPLYVLELRDPYQLATFIFLHELYHWLIRKARRNVRQKEGRCDRFAARGVIRAFGLTMLDECRRPAAAEEWDFQDLDGFVAAAQRVPRPVRQAARKVIPVPRAPAIVIPTQRPLRIGEQLLLFLTGRSAQRR